jgi:hypothetical protein
MTHRPKPQKRKRAKVDRRVHRDRTRPGRVFRVRPDPVSPVVVEIRITKDRRRMREAMEFHDGRELADWCETKCMGLVRSWHSPRTGRHTVTRNRHLLARMYLNERDLRYRPSEIVAHECTHAGMAWARLRRANLRVMPGEEVLCHGVGRLVSQVNRVCFAHGVWPR